MSEISQAAEDDGQRSMLSRIFSVMEGRHYHEVFREYAAAKNLNSECPSCGKRDWWVTPPPREGYTPGENIIAKNAAGEGAVGFAPKMMLNCKHCGLERAYDLHMIAAWLEERESKGDAE